MEDVVSGEVQFYAHCTVSWGVKSGHWEKVGKSAMIGNIRDIIFRGTSDYARMDGGDPILVSSNWYVWRIGDDDFSRVGKLTGENRTAEIGLVLTEEDIVDRLRTGEYELPGYPEFE